MNIKDNKRTLPSPRGSRTPTSEAIWTLSVLALHLDELDDSPSEVLFQRVFVYLWNLQELDADALLEEAIELAHEGSNNARLSIFVASVALAVKAIKAEKAGDLNAAWTYAFDAIHGATVLLCSSREGRLNTMALRGAHASNAENRQLKADTIAHFLANKETYRSKNQAAQAIAGKVVPLTFRTVLNYLKDQPFPNET
jgi:hypothetical protein